MMDPRLVELLACLPKREAATRATIFGVVAAYGFSEDKRWAKWVGGIGLGLVALNAARCFVGNARRLAEGESAAPRRLEGAAPAASNGTRPNLVLMNENRAEERR